MFNGLIREVAKVNSFDGKFLKISSSLNPDIGDSIAINGACLTATGSSKESFIVEVSDESRNLLALENFRDLVHIEPAMRFGDKIDGHLIQGHIDTLATLKEIRKNSNSYDLFFSIDREFMKFIAPKGSIAVDGVSLTVNETFGNSFRLTIIPHTFENTLFKSYRVGRRVNIETDMFARYLYNMFKGGKNSSWDEVDSIMSFY
jgi:riboflavin synthase